jgi:hypothetical protein
MMLRKGLFALAAATVVGLAARDGSAAVVSLTVDGCQNGETIHTTVTFHCNSSLLSINSKGKKVTQLCGGIVFAAPPCNPNFNAPGDIIPKPDPTECHQNDAPDSPLPETLDINPDPTEHCGPPPWQGECHDPYITFTGPEGIPSLDLGDAPATPLPASVWGASALMGSLGIVRRIKRNKQ